MTSDDLAAHARTLLDTNLYLTLGTVDPSGRPWTSPVYFAAAGVREFYWTSETNAVHSRNLAERPQVSIVVFDSTVRPYHGRALYAAGEARELAGDDLERGLEVYPGPADRDATGLTWDDVTGSSPYRLYRATATDVWVLCPREPRQPCPLHGLAKDHRARIEQ
ncbi:pyridoxamine 5'-phosphate oxidase family protein [Paractinoplanes globisporus]|uniref:Pyridoxamine 5'-phosphate oxidase family protein n=1 Tax=Paractinoplanes globisporus TaxID=113565 RepID=A0ABW6WGV1_9ACTN|nr:pyridoxamine 5'-phosphate oxidase family protein [Actinoplanes globisporus]